MDRLEDAGGTPKLKRDLVTSHASTASQTGANSLRVRAARNDDAANADLPVIEYRSDRLQNSSSIR